MGHTVMRTRVRAGIARVFGIGACVVLASACVAGGVAYALYRQAVRELPPPEAIAAATLVADTVLTDRNGHRLAALPNGPEHREVVPYAAVSPHLRDAIVASEDSRFWKHGGVDPRGVARAFAANFVAGGVRQGGSTITQQLLKQLLLKGRPPILRKIEEALLAARVEALLTKREILALYANTIALGSGNAGVAAAARDAFGLDVGAVTLAEAALIAGVIPAPARYHLCCAPEATRRRQHHVLDRMVATGVIGKVEADRARRAPVRLQLADDAPAEAAVASAVDAAAEASDGAMGTVVTTVDLPLQLAAADALQATLAGYARRRGEYRGARFRLTPSCLGWADRLREFRSTVGAWRADPREILAYDLRGVPPSRCPPEPCRFGARLFRRLRSGDVVSGVVTALDGRHATLDLGDLTGVLPLRAIAWTRKALWEIAPVGAVLDVRLPASVPTVRGATVTVALEPRPVVEGAVVALDPRTGEVRAIVGGVEPRRGDLNRALAARRPMGSTVKPFAFGAAIAAGAFDVHGDVHDLPYRYVDPWTGDLWAPENWYMGHLGAMPVAEAIARSVNAAAVEATFRIGADRLAGFLDAVGIPGAIAPRPALALGVAEVTPIELASAYAVLANGGHRVAPTFLPAAQSSTGPAGDRVLDPTFVAHVDWLLRQPIEHPQGTARRLGALGLNLRGKTGTTNAARDAWFAGYTPELVVVVWIGYDAPQPLATDAGEESGGSLAVPVAARVFAVADAVIGLSPASSAGPLPVIAAPFGPAAPASVRALFARVEEEVQP